MDKLAGMIRTYRKQHNLTQADFEEASGLASRKVSDLEQAKRTSIDVVEFFGVAYAMDMYPDQLAVELDLPYARLIPPEKRVAHRPPNGTNHLH
jgi:transcriptional regulator with XRE-family HTH domain